MRALLLLVMLVPVLAYGEVRPAYRITDRATGTTFLYVHSEPPGVYEEMVAFAGGSVEEARRLARQWRFENFLLCSRVSPVRFVTVGTRTFAITFFTRSRSQRLR
jgi:hypothetical protein